MNHVDEPIRPEFPTERFDAIASPFKHFIDTGGVVLLVAPSLRWSLPIPAWALRGLLVNPGGLRFGDLVWEHSLRHWINDGLVTLFFNSQRP
jgi:NhaA family Na+:H+ antiporter